MSGFAEELIIQNCVKCNRKLCTLYERDDLICGKLNTKNCLNTAKIVKIICTKCLDLHKN